MPHVRQKHFVNSMQCTEHKEVKKWLKPQEAEAGGKSKGKSKGKGRNRSRSKKAKPSAKGK